MKQRILPLESIPRGRQVRRSQSLRSRTGNPCSPKRNALKLILALSIFRIPVSDAITLDAILKTTLEKNPAIQQAKINLEQAVGQRLVFRSVAWPSVKVDAPAGVQGGHRAGENSIQIFGVVRGTIMQPLFDAAIPPSLRRGNVEVLIAQQQLNLAVIDQLHSARLAFYSALYNRDLLSLSGKQQRRLDQNVASQKDRYRAGLIDRSAFTGATVEARELDSEIESDRRAYSDAQLRLAEAMALADASKANLPEPEGDLDFNPMVINVDSETATTLKHRTDLKLAHLLVQAAEEDQRIIEAGYYPRVLGSVSGYYLPVSGIHREGSTSRTQDFLSSEAQETAAYTWQVIDNGKVAGAALTQRKTREINEIACRKLEANVARELLRIRNDLEAVELRHKSLAAAVNSAEEDTVTVRQNLGGGLASELEYRLAESNSFKTRTGLLAATYQYNAALAEWDRATGRYFQFSEDTSQNVH
jgi:outer membrane protein TolC